MSSLSEQDERLQNEISILEAMYPDQISWTANERLFKYSIDKAACTLRLPDGYLRDDVPDVVSATVDGSDAREALRQSTQAYAAGEEALDSIVLEFTEIANSMRKDAQKQTASNAPPSQPNELNVPGKATIIVWLHHLLNTNKRKHALHPDTPSSDVSGVTKPGYPGVLIYSGAADNVHEHVNALKQLNWQAFQVRYESEEEWSFAHGSGVREVETMKDIVAEVGEDRKQAFMEAMRMR